MANVLENLKTATAMFDNLNLNRMNLGTGNSNAYSAYVPPIPKKMRVYTLSRPDCFIVQDLQNTEDSKNVLLLERKESGPGKFANKTLGEAKQMMRSYTSSVDGYGVLGIIKIPSGTFLIVITECKLAAKLMGSEVYCITDTAFLPFMNVEGMDPLEKQSLDNSTKEFRKWLNTDAFYFSYTYDITIRAQEVPEANKQTPHHTTTDLRFFWNRHIQNFFIKNKLEEWILPVMKGFISSAQCRINGHLIDVTLISRLGAMRAGTRFNTRGVNDDGNVANFVETEQLVIADGKLTSFVQIRGSVPVFWEQRLIRGKHRTTISRGREATAPAFRLHFDELLKRYGKQYVVNLLTNNESEKIISDAYEEQLKLFNHPDVQYIGFDFHEKLGKTGGKFNMIGPLLLDGLQSDLNKFGIYIRDKEGHVLMRQKGVFRTNCLDCLDRTNVTQSAIARRAFINALQALQIFPSNQTYDNFELTNAETEEMMKHIWAFNGDSISLSYTGTGALKGGLIKNGKLTLGGMLDDSVRSVMRTYHNNFKDNDKQEVIDYFLGNQLGSEELAEEEDWLASQLKARASEYTDNAPLTIYIGTWNVNGQRPGEDLSMWLTNISPAPNFPDIYAIGFQEVVSLTANSVWNADQTNTNLWHQQILELISRQNKFVLLRSYQLVGIVLSLFVREDYVPFIREVHSEIVKVGFKGIAGNKGAISMRFNFHQSSFCFTCAHFAAGSSNVEERNANYHEIMNNTTFRTSKGSYGIMDHDYVFYLGDLNYRISLPYEEVRKNITQNNFLYLGQFDQLLVEMNNERIFRGFSEGPLGFPPTYKFDPGTDVYDSSEKRRTPAWCDRILFHADTIKQYNYKYSPMLTSDHKPVSACFLVQAKVVNKAKQEKVAAELSKLMPNTDAQSTKVPQALLVDIFDESPSESATSSPQQTPTLTHSAASSQPALDTMWDPFSDISFPSSENSSPSLSQNGSPATQQRPPALPPKPASNGSNSSTGSSSPFDDWFTAPAQPLQPTTAPPALPPKPASNTAPLNPTSTNPFSLGNSLDAKPTDGRGNNNNNKPPPKQIIMTTTPLNTAVSFDKPLPPPPTLTFTPKAGPNYNVNLMEFGGFQGASTPQYTNPQYNNQFSQPSPMMTLAQQQQYMHQQHLQMLQQRFGYQPTQNTNAAPPQPQPQQPQQQPQNNTDDFGFFMINSSNSSASNNNLPTLQPPPPTGQRTRSRTNPNAKQNDLDFLGL